MEAVRVEEAEAVDSPRGRQRIPARLTVTSPASNMHHLRKEVPPRAERTKPLRTRERRRDHDQPRAS